MKEEYLYTFRDRNAVKHRILAETMNDAIMILFPYSTKFVTLFEFYGIAVVEIHFEDIGPMTYGVKWQKTNEL